MALPPISSSPTLKLESSRPAGLSLKIGQQLTAQVMQRVDNTTYQLMAGRQQLLATSSRPLVQGQTLQLQVSGFDKQQHPILQVRQAPAQQQQITQALRASLPVQQSLKPLPADLLSATRNPQTPPQIKQGAIRILQNALPLSSSVSARAVQQAISNSGQFMENHLLKNPTQTRQDLKANLARLLQSLQTTNTSANRQPTSTTLLLKQDSQNLQPDAQPRQASQPPQSAGSQSTATSTANPLLYSKPQARMPATNTQQTAQLLNAQTDKAATQVLSQPSQANTPAKPLPHGPATAPASDVVTQPRNLQKPMDSVQQQIRQNPATPAQTQANHETDQLQQKNTLLQLLGKTTGALHKIQSQQLQHLQSLADATPNWHMSIPLQIDEHPLIMELMIQKEPQDSSSEDSPTDEWQFYIHLDLPGLGPMQVNLGLHDNHLNTRFIVESPETHALLQAHTDKLTQQLEAKELQVNRLDCILGEAKMPEQKIADSLLEDNA